MGAYLSSPICEKDTFEGSNDRLAFAASSMQGWRMSQEDAHNAILNFDEKTSFFAVYDGHGGAEIALYCSRHLPDFLKQLDSYREGQLKEALTEGFLKFDSLLLQSDVKEVLQEIADAKEKNDDDEQIDDPAHDIVIPRDNNHNDELNVEEASLLKKEAEIPIEELRKRYSGSGKQLQSPMISKRPTSNPLVDQIDGKTKNSQGLKELRGAQGKTDDTAAVSVDTDQLKTDVVSHADEENTPADDVLDHKIAETMTNTINGEKSDAVEPKPSSSEPKSTTRRARKAVSSDTTTSTTTAESKSLTHHLLNDDINEIEDDEDDFELEESDDQSSDGEDAGDDDDEDEEGDDEEEEEEEEGDTEEEMEGEDDDDDDNNKQLDPSKAAQIKNLMRKSIMAILNRKAKRSKNRGGDDDNDGKENQNDDEDEEEKDDEGEDDAEDDEEEDADDENDADLGKMLDMSSDPGSSSGCTAVVTLLRDKELFVANAGDSRCVLCRNGRAIEMSFDHKPEDPEERTRIEKAGYKVTLDGRVSGGLNLSRAIGDHAYKKTASLPAEEQAITALPDIRTLTLENEDEFMVIACDGIWNFMSSQDVIDFVRVRLQKKPLGQICEELFTHCLAPNTSGDGTGCDNMTAIIVKFNFNQPSTKQSNVESVVSKNVEQSPWPTMFSSNQKRTLSPEHSPTSESSDNNSSSSKKLKKLAENGANDVTSPSKTSETFSFTTSTNNNTNSNADQPD